MLKRQRTPEIPWEVTVATATPVVPIWKTMTKRRSRMIFRTEEKIRAKSGVRLSPIALKIAEAAL